MKQLHPGAKWAFRLRAYAVLFFLGIFFGFWITGPIFIVLFNTILGASIGSTIFIIIFIGLFYLLFIIIFAEIYARMSYNRWFYEFTDSQLRLERGIIWKRYSNVPYERIQNVDIYRGILARMLGYSTVLIQTAGYSYTPKGGISAEGYIPAVSMEEAEHIREFVMKKVSKRRNQGL